MALLQIAYWRTVGLFTPGAIAQVPAGLVASESVEITSSSEQSGLWPAQTSIAELYAEADCFVSIGADPDAAAEPQFSMAAGTHRYIGLSDGSTKFAVIAREVGIDAKTIIAATTDAVSVSELTAMRTVVGVEYLVAAVGLTAPEIVPIYILIDDQWVRLVNRETEEEMALYQHIPQATLTGGPVYGFAKDATVSPTKVVGWK